MANRSRSINRNESNEPGQSGLSIKVDKRRRRSNATMAAHAARVIELLAEEQPMNVRQIFYRFTSEGLMEKTEKGYRRVGYQLRAMRKAGTIDYGAIADNTRWVRKPASYSNPQEAIAQLLEYYRRSRWDNQRVYVEVWLEKDALANVLLPVTAHYDVPLMVCRGFASMSYMHSASQTIATKDKPTVLLYFGDYDASGVEIPEKVYAGIKEFLPGKDVELRRLAVNEDQIRMWNLQTRPPKQNKNDHRSKKWGNKPCVEVDAIPPNMLRSLVEESIREYIDQKAWKAAERQEKKDRAYLAKLIGDAA
jgi:hypothetical protein